MLGLLRACERCLASIDHQTLPLPQWRVFTDMGRELVRQGRHGEAERYFKKVRLAKWVGYYAICLVWIAACNAMAQCTASLVCAAGCVKHLGGGERSMRHRLPAQPPLRVPAALASRAAPPPPPHPRVRRWRWRARGLARTTRTWPPPATTWPSSTASGGSTTRRSRCTSRRVLGGLAGLVVVLGSDQPGGLVGYTTVKLRCCGRWLTAHLDVHRAAGPLPPATVPTQAALSTMPCCPTRPVCRRWRC